MDIEDAEGEGEEEVVGADDMYDIICVVKSSRFELERPRRRIRV